MRWFVTLALAVFIALQWYLGFGWITRWGNWYLVKPQMDAWHAGDDLSIITGVITLLMCILIEATLFAGLLVSTCTLWSWHLRARQ